MCFLGMLTRKFGNSILIGGDVGQDSRNSTRNIIYVRKSSQAISVFTQCTKFSLKAAS